MENSEKRMLEMLELLGKLQDSECQERVAKAMLFLCRSEKFLIVAREAIQATRKNNPFEIDPAAVAYIAGFVSALVLREELEDAKQ